MASSISPTSIQITPSPENHTKDKPTAPSDKQEERYKSQFSHIPLESLPDPVYPHLTSCCNQETLMHLGKVSRKIGVIAMEAVHERMGMDKEKTQQAFKTEQFDSRFQDAFKRTIKDEELAKNEMDVAKASPYHLALLCRTHNILPDQFNSGCDFKLRRGSDSCKWLHPLGDSRLAILNEYYPHKRNSKRRGNLSILSGIGKQRVLTFEETTNANATGMGAYSSVAVLDDSRVAWSHHKGISICDFTKRQEKITFNPIEFNGSDLPPIKWTPFYS